MRSRRAIQVIMEIFKSNNLSFGSNRVTGKKNLQLKKHDDSKIQMEPSFGISSKKKLNPPPRSNPNEVHISELQSLFKNPKQFMWLFGVEYHLPPKSYITWPYMIAIVKGQKRLAKSRDIRLTTQLPRFEQLSMKKIWPKYKDRDDIKAYLPILGENANPPRRYFFEVLHSQFEEEFNQVIINAKNERTRKRKKINKVIVADPDLLTEIRSLNIWTNIANSKMTKRVLTTPSKRKRTRAMDSIFTE